MQVLHAVGELLQASSAVPRLAILGGAGGAAPALGPGGMHSVGRQPRATDQGDCSAPAAGADVSDGTSVVNGGKQRFLDRVCSCLCA